MLPTWDLVITIVFLVISGYNFILRREQMLKLLFAAYVGLAIASVWGEAVQHFVAGNNALANNFLEGETTLSSVKIGIFIILTLLITIKADYIQTKNINFGWASPLIWGILSMLSTLLLFTSIFSFLDENSLNFLLRESNLANFIIKYQIWFFVVPALLLIVLGFFGKERKRKSP